MHNIFWVIKFIQITCEFWNNCIHQDAFGGYFALAFAMSLMLRVEIFDINAISGKLDQIES